VKREYNIDKFDLNLMDVELDIVDDGWNIYDWRLRDDDDQENNDIEDDGSH
jgi:hypothetical protein